jgi:pimeloyl-ACP methyl ester carboxylesterase
VSVELLFTREYGTAGPLVLVLHGGPGAAGHAVGVARGLAGAFRVLEPFQRASGGAPLTVRQHVEDLQVLIESRAEPTPPVLVGTSWGAMLALAFAAAHPELAGPLVLIGCGTFDLDARVHLHATLEERMTPALRARLRRLDEQIPDPNALMEARMECLTPVYSYDAVEPEPLQCDARAMEETWADMVRLQAEGVYPAAFKAVRSPVLMLHGTFDPHPGRMILESLRPHLPRIEYREWARCGHSPWLERAVRDEFFQVLTEWLLHHAGGAGR